jgi:SAM-dependent methyltransferase
LHKPTSTIFHITNHPADVRIVIDLWGRIYLDHWRGEAHPHEFVRDDGKAQMIPSAAGYFVAPRSAAEQQALVSLTGRVLDLGCGAGSYTRFLEERGISVTAVDSSPGAITVCRARGCQDAHVAAIDDLPARLGQFDAIICMGNTLGIGCDPDLLTRRLARIRAVSTPAARFLAAIRDPLSASDPDHLAYHARNRAAGRPVGLVRSRLRYRGEVGDWWELWMPTEPEITLAAARGGWTARCLYAEGSGRLYELTRSG